MLKTSELTPGERLLIERRRYEMSIDDAAAAWGVSLYRYRKWEADEGEVPDCRVGRLEFREQSFVRRRRAGLSVGAFAAKLGVSPEWIRLMETGEASDERLRDWWAAQDRRRRGRRAARSRTA